MKKLIVTLLKFLVAGALIYWCIRTGKIDLGRLREKLPAAPGWTAIGFGLSILAGCVTVQRWRTLLHAQDIQLSFFQAFRLTYIGFFFNIAMPGATGGDVIKAVYVARGQSKKAEAVTTIILDRVIGLYGLISLALIAILFRLRFLWNHAGQPVALGLTNTQLLILVTAGSLLAGILAALALLSQTLKESERFDRFLGWIPLGRLFRKVYDATYLYRSRKDALLLCVVYSWIAQSIAAVSCYCFGQVIGDTLGLATYFLLIPLGLVINGIPIAPMGWGIGEVGFSKLFEIFGSASGGTLAALLHVVQFLTNALGAIFFVVGDVEEIKHIRDEAKRESAENPEG